jgi:hypothetical protein
MQEKLDWNFFSGLFKDAIGYESGFLKTTMDLVRVPHKVVAAVKTGETTYVNPIRYLLSCCGYFILVNSFLIDWKAVGKRHDEEFTAFFGSEASNTNFAFMADFLFSTTFVPIVLFTGILKIFLVTKMSKKVDVTVKEHIAVVFYVAALGTFLTFWISLVFALLPFIYSMVLNSIYSFLAILFPARLLTIRNVDSFLPEKKDKLLKIYRRADMILIFVIILMVFIYIYFERN